MRTERPSPLPPSPLDPHFLMIVALKRTLALDQILSPDFVPEDESSLGNDRPDTALSSASSNDSLLDSPRRWTGASLLRSLIGPGSGRSQSQSPSRRSITHIEPRSAPVTQAAATDDAMGAWRRQSQRCCFRFSLETVDRGGWASSPVLLTKPQLPFPGGFLLARSLGQEDEDDENEQDEPFVAAKKSPTRAARSSSAYCGRALAEWQILVNECGMFFERRKLEGVPGNRFVETPALLPEWLKGQKG
jgi:hypothetical protein